MKKKVVLFLHLAMLLVLLIAADPVDIRAERLAKQNPGQLEYVDGQIDKLNPKLKTFQDTYYKDHGKYFQGVNSKNITPDINCGAVPPDLTGKPTDQIETLESLWDYVALPDVLEYTIRVDVYEGPSGAGYVLVVTALVDGVTWERDINVGPETYRDQPWFEVGADL